MSRTEHLGRVALLCVLMINLSLVAFYQAGCARVQTASTEAHAAVFAVGVVDPCCPDEELPDPIPQELQDLLDAQESIHTQLFPFPFTQSYEWCFGVGWQLDQELLEGPSDPWEPILISGTTWKEQPVWMEVYEVHRWTDFSEANLTESQREWVDEHDFAFGVMGVNATGSIGSVELWGMTQAFTHPTLGRLVNFTPLVEASVIPPADPENLNCPNAPPGCLDNARGCLDLCLQNATDLFGIAGTTIFLEALVAYLICLARAPVPPGPTPATMAVCAIVVGLPNLAALIGAIIAYLALRGQCYNAYAQDVTNCCNGFMRAPCQ